MSLSAAITAVTFYVLNGTPLPELPPAYKSAAIERVKSDAKKRKLKPEQQKRLDSL